MKRIIIVTHKKLALGLQDSLNFFTNMNDQITAIPAYEHDDNQFPDEIIKKKIVEFKNNNDQIFILTDLLGGSVNQHILKFVDNNTFVITGVNLPLALSILLSPYEYLTLNQVQKVVSEAKEQIILMNTYNSPNSEDDE
ncbi:PTS sugar transporter subunit IIA [Bombilactobacillus bombi]|nr:PTS N-acetylglucosamine transporter subunit IIBC [Bombilactobacillus bombi]